MQSEETRFCTRL